MRTIILKVTHICNLGCRYCCVGDNNDNEIVSKRTLRNLFSKLANDSSESTIIWHGGEPLSVGIDYYKEVLKLQELYPQHRFHNSIQTNGTLLNDEFLLFFLEHNFSLGFSLDGNKISHDLNRPFKDGKSSFDVTLKWFKRAQELGMNVGAICVINANTARHIENIYSFARNNQIPFKFNPQYPAGRATINVDLGLDNNHIAETYIKLFDLWYNDDPKSRANIRMFDVFVEGIADLSNGGKSWHGYDCSFCNRCQKSFLGMAPNGDLYPCGKFVGEEHYKYGNINEDKDLQTLLNNDIRQVFLERHELGVEGCKDCRYYSLCSSGCPYNAVLYNKDIHSKNPICSSLMPLFKHIEQRVKERTRFKDIYIIPLENNSNSSLVYSPLRGNCFVADDIAVKQINRYLDSNGENKCLNTILQDYLDKWEEQIPLSPKNYSVFSPNQVVLLLTQKCNLSCSYCFAKNARAAKALSKDTIKAVVDFVFSTKPEQYKTFSFLGGGEPTVEWDLLEWSISYIRHHQPHNNVHISITTNGTLLSESRISLLK